MTRRRRAIALGVLSVLLGILAWSDVSGREAALNRRLGPTAGVLVARSDLEPGTALGPRALAVRQVPTRYLPAAVFTRSAQVRGLKTAVAVAAGTDLTGALLRDPSAPEGASSDGSGLPGSTGLRPGQRIAQIVANGDPARLAAGSRIDLLVTRETAGGEGNTTLALQDAEVLTAAPAAADDSGSSGNRPAGSPRVALSLKVSLRQAVALAAAQNFAKELRVLVRTPGDHRHGPQDMQVTDASR